MESLRPAPQTRMSGDLANDLPEQLRKAITNTRSTEQAIAELEPADAVTWLIVEEQTARVMFSDADLAHLLSAVVGAALARQQDTRVADLAELVQRYAEVVGADTVASLASALPEDQRCDVIREVVAAVMKREPLHAELLRSSVDMAVRDGDAPEAHRLLNRLARANHSQANLHYVWRKRAALPASGDPPVRAALMSSFTVDPLLHYLDLECRTLGLDPELYMTPFNSWAQEVLGEESGLRRFDPEIAFLSVSIDDLIPELAGALPAAELQRAGETAVERVLAVVRHFATRSDGVLVVHSFHSTFRDPQGILAGHAEPSRADWLAKLNAQLAEGLKTLPRAYLLDVTDQLLRRHGGALDNAKMRHMAAMRFCGPVLSELAHAYASFIAPLKGLTRKCVVLDLDNTLWGGIVGEDGAHGIKLGNTSPGSEYQEFQHYLLSLTERGHLLAINSKNNPEEALDVIRNHEGMILRVGGFQLYLQLEDIDHTKTRAKRPQSNGICERFQRTVQEEFYFVTFRKKIYTTLEELQADLDAWVEQYNTERTHQGIRCQGRTPLQTFLDSKQLAQQKKIA